MTTSKPGVYPNLYNNGYLIVTKSTELVSGRKTKWLTEEEFLTLRDYFNAQSEMTRAEELEQLDEGFNGEEAATTEVA